MSTILLRIITGIALTMSFTFLYFFTPAWVISLLFFFMLLYVLCFEWVLFTFWGLTPFYPVLPFLCLIFISQIPARYLLAYLFIIVFSHDTGAYFIGKYFGKHKLAPRISPQKTFEGVIGGFGCSLVITFLFNLVCGPSWQFTHLLTCIIIFNIFGVLGDLFESFLKRRAHLKDSGNLLPGHGGLLDRFDSILINAVIIVILWHIVPTIFF